MRHAVIFLTAALAFCLAPSSRPQAADTATKAYNDPTYGFTIHYPANAKIATNNPDDNQLEMTSNAPVVVSLNLADYKGTNLGEASVSVGVSNDPTVVASCAAGGAAQGETPAGTETLGGIKFTRFTFEDAGAGNRYESTIYRAVSGRTCYELVEFLHWAAMENFSPGAIKAFDQPKIEAELRAITRSFALTGRAL